MPRQLWLPDALRDEGLPVTTHPGWETRGFTLFDPIGVLGRPMKPPAEAS